MQQFKYSDWPLTINDDFALEQSALKISDNSELEENKVFGKDI